MVTKRSNSTKPMLIHVKQAGRMSLEEKIEQLHGSKSSRDVGTEKGLYWSGENSAQGIPPLKW